MSNEINFKIELKGNNGVKKLILNHDSGQGANEVLVSIGQEAIVVSPWDLANMTRRAFEMLVNDDYEQQVRTNVPHGVTRPADRMAQTQSMPPMPMFKPHTPQRPAPLPPPPRPVNDPDDK